ncbi:MAG: SET domain-containing protein [Cyanothece sp. SIO2G6]|nr:SET domain-containing protein [Cyanothece sp. SIO2G6]
MAYGTLLAIQTIASKGRGVFATQAIAPDTVLETAPVASFPATERSTIDTTHIAKYYFVQPDAYRQGQTVDGYLVFGLASLCNHDNEPNAKIEWVVDEIGLWTRLISTQEIAAGEEVTIYYTNIEDYNFS